ncbi:MAG: hypothetical protein KDC98_13745 [Planctomycetes bacterium]|nr:hypothetical protein [Planctomycetota bacterium]
MVPEGYANQVEDSSNVFPFGTISPIYQGLRILHIYDSADFTNQQINVPILITGLKWRAQDTTTSWTGGSFSNVTIKMSTAAVDHLAASMVYAANHGPDLTVMHSGSVTVQAGTGNGYGVPGPWFVDVPFATPFLYDPTTGNDLCIDVDNLGVAANWSGGSTTALASVSSSGVPAPNARRVYASTQYPNANGIDQNILVCEISYAPAAGYAQSSTYGTGCYQTTGTSFYELFPSGGNDLSNTSMSLFHSPAGYTAIGGIATLRPTAGATALALTDNSEVTQVLSSGSIPYGYDGSATALTICSNGFVAVGTTGNGTGSQPSAGVFLNAARTGWWCWHDYDPAATGGGRVMWEETASSVYITWDGVFSRGTTGPGSTFQFQLEKSTGLVAYVWGTIDNTGNGHLIGFSEGGPRADPGSMDLSVALQSVFTNDFQHDAIALGASARPVIGTSIALQTTRIPAGTPIGGTIMSLLEINPGVAIPGMPGCERYVGLDAVVLFLPTTSTASVAFPIPANNSLAGVEVKAQSAAVAAGVNPLNAVVSNGLKLLLDLN